ncbi:MAG: hypothetical protein B193_1777, partial [Solidesulfovibrio magneticus str. Maddingley MBC34]
MKTILAALILCLLALSPAHAGQKGIGQPCNSDNSTVDFDTLAQCNGSTLIKAPLMLGAVANPPYASTACDAAKAGMLQYTGGVVQYCNGSAWSTMGSSSGTGGQSMVSGWPDVIVCTDSSNNKEVLYANGMPYNSHYIYRLIANTVGDIKIIFNSDGTYYSNSGADTYDCVTSSMSISTLVANGRAFNFVNGGANGAAAMADGTAGAPGLYFSANTNTGLYRPTTDTLAIATGGTERLRVTATGSVGIGTTTPELNLHVKGIGVRLENSGSTQKWELGYHGTNDFTIFDASTNVSRLFVQATSGNVGIGTTAPNALLNVGVNGAASRQLSLGSWGDLGAGSSGSALFGGNVYYSGGG